MHEQLIAGVQDTAAGNHEDGRHSGPLAVWDNAGVIPFAIAGGRRSNKPSGLLPDVRSFAPVDSSSSRLEPARRFIREGPPGDSRSKVCGPTLDEVDR
jgi:hypothetical protein